MQYISERHDVVVNASGGYNALERLGFMSEESQARKTKKVEGATRIKAWVAENCCAGCKRKADLCVCVDGVPPAPRVVVGGPSRKSLMDEAKTRGIAYFRVMNKEELVEIVVGDSQAMRDDAGSRIKMIQETAKARWQAGWKK